MIEIPCAEKVRIDDYQLWYYNLLCEVLLKGT